MRSFPWFVVMFLAFLFAAVSSPAEAAGGRLFSKSACSFGRCGVVSAARTVVRGSAAAVGSVVRGTGRVAGSAVTATRTVVRGTAEVTRSVIRGTTATAQGVAEIQASHRRVGHHGGRYAYEGVGSGSTPEQALRRCCTNGRAVVDQGVAQGADGVWYACRRYAP